MNETGVLDDLKNRYILPTRSSNASRTTLKILSETQMPHVYSLANVTQLGLSCCSATLLHREHFNNFNIMTCSNMSAQKNCLSHPRPCRPKQSDRVAFATTIRWHHDHHVESSQKQRARNFHVCQCHPMSAMLPG